MIGRLIDLSVRNRGIVVMVTAALAAAGVMAMYNLRLDAIPDLSDVQVIVMTEYPGQSPQVVEDQVTYPLTTAMLSVPYAEVVRGYSFFGLSFVYLIFEDGTDLYWARSRVLEYLNFVRNQLPASVSPRLGPDATAVGWVYQYVIESGYYCPGYEDGLWAHDPDGQLGRLHRSNAEEAGVDWYGAAEDAPKEQRQALVRVRVLPPGTERCPVGGGPTSAAASDLSDLRSLQDWYLRYELAAVDGVSEVASIGGFVRQYQVTVDPNRLLAYGVSIQSVREAIRRSNSDVGGRVVEESETEYMVRGLGYIRGTDDLRRVSLGATDSGSPIYLEDVATVGTGPDIRRGIGEWNGGGEAVGGIVLARFGENPYRVISRVKMRIDELQSGLPPGVGVTVAYDRSQLIERVVGTLRSKLLEEMTAVALVCLLFLFHLRSALVAIVALPLGVLMSVALMNFIGVNANVMSLGGIAIAIGVMVDASVVMVENAHRKIELDGRDRPRIEVIAEAAREVGPALFYSLVIITVSFLPVFALGQESGRLFRPLAYTKTFAMGFSALVAVTVTPVLMTYLVRGRISSQQRNPLARGLMRLYRPVIAWAFTDRRRTVRWAVAVVALTVLPLVGIGSISSRLGPGLEDLQDSSHIRPVRRLAAGAAAFLGAGQALFPGLGREFMPPLNEGDLLYMPTTDPGVSVTKAREILQQTDKLIASFPEVHHVFGKIGRAETATDPAPLSMLETTIVLEPERERWRRRSVERFFSSWPFFLRTPLSWLLPLERPITTEELIYGWDRSAGEHVAGLNDTVRLPGLTNAWTMPIKTRIDMLSTGIKTPVGIKVMGPRLDRLEELAENVAVAVRPLDGTVSAYAEKALGGNYLDFEIDREEVARYGLTIADLQEVIMSAMGGMNVTFTVEGLERYPVNLRYPRELRDDRSALERTLIATPTGAQVPISQLTKIRVHKGPPVIKSENARRTAWVYVDIAGVDVGSYVSAAKRAVADAVRLPPGYSLVWSGQYEYMREAASRLRVLVPAAVLLILVLLYFHFGNFRESLIVMLGLPFALAGGVWLIWALDHWAAMSGGQPYNLSVAVYVGFIALAGLAVETGVVMLVYLEASLKAAANDGSLSDRSGLRRAVMEGALQRVRPLLMTVTTTLIGLLPIMWGSAAGSAAMKRIAAPMVGGLISSTALTLVLIPVVYEMVMERRLNRSG